MHSCNYVLDVLSRGDLRAMIIVPTPPSTECMYMPPISKEKGKKLLPHMGTLQGRMINSLSSRSMVINSNKSALTLYQVGAWLGSVAASLKKQF